MPSADTAAIVPVLRRRTDNRPTLTFETFEKSYISQP